jgi:hypothetical protein
MTAVLTPKRLLTKITLMAVLSAIITVGLTGAAPAAESQSRTLHMISIGETYHKDKGGQKQTPLPCCEKDADDMVAWANSQKGKLFDNVDARRMVDTDAKASDIVTALQGLKGRVKPGDYTIVYMSGHGGCRPQGEFQFCAHDRNVSWGQVRQALRGLPGTTIVIVDACQAGGIRDNDNMIVLSASLAEQNSAAAKDAKANSLYTRFLLEGLRGRADLNGDGRITLTELEAYVSNRLEAHGAAQQSTTLRPANVPSSLPIARLTANNAPAVQLAGTTWTGRENPGTGNFGTLSFRFAANGQVTMIDAQSTVNGTYTVTGSRVSITLPNVACYTGTVNGTSFSGEGNCTSLGTWNFNVERK